MKSPIWTTVCVATVLSVAACAVTTTKQNPAEARTVQSGAREKVAYFYNLTDKCQPDGIPQITVLKTPANGAVTIGSGENRSQYAADNPRSACNQQPVSSAEVYYQSAPNFRGADDFSIQVRYSSSFTQTFSYNVTVN